MASGRSRAVLCCAVLMTVVLSVYWLQSSKSVEPLLEQARRARLRGETDAAISTLREVVEAEPAHDVAWLMLGQMLLKSGDDSEGLEALRQVSDSSALQAARARFLEASKLLQRGDAVNAELLFQRALEFNPNLQEAQFALRRLYFLQMRRHEIRALLSIRHSRAAWDLGDLVDYLIAGEYLDWEGDVGIERLAEFCALNPSDQWSCIALARHYRRMSKTAEGIELISSLLERFPQNQMARSLYADLAMDNGDIDHAREVLARTVQETEYHPWLYRSFGRYSSEIGELEEARSYYQQAAMLDPDDSLTVYRLSQILRMLDEDDQAQVMVNRVEKLELIIKSVKRIIASAGKSHTPQTDALCDLGDQLHDLGRVRTSTMCYQVALSGDPLDARAKESYMVARQLRMQSTTPVSANLPLRELTPIAFADLGPAVNVSPPVFEDVATRSGLQFTYENGRREEKYLIHSMGGGVSAVDLDGDRLSDLYFAQGGVVGTDGLSNESNQLFRLDPTLQYINITDHAGLGDHNYGLGVITGDFDNDGFVDILLSNFGQNQIYTNNGDGTFSLLNVVDELRADFMSTSGAWCDFDRDGDLDLYVVNYLASHESCKDDQGRSRVCHPQNFEARQDQVFENLGDGSFREVTDSSGIVVPNGKGLAIVASDLDGNGWPDVYVANDTTANFMFRNLGDSSSIRFESIGLISGAALNEYGQPEAGMGLAAADFTDDGNIDLYVSNFYRETNTLYENLGDLNFIDVTTGSGMAAATNTVLGFGLQAIDANLNGKLDIMVANGHIDDLSDRGIPYQMFGQLFANQGNSTFRDVTHESGSYFLTRRLGRGVARLDWNSDGKPDVVIVHQGSPASLLENRTVSDGDWIQLRFIGRCSNRDATNVRCSLTTEARTMVREITGGDGYLSTNERSIIYRLNGGESVENLLVWWPSGRVEQFESIAVRRSFTIIEGTGVLTE